MAIKRVSDLDWTDKNIAVFKKDRDKNIDSTVSAVELNKKYAHALFEMSIPGAVDTAAISATQTTADYYNSRKITYKGLMLSGIVPDVKLYMNQSNALLYPNNTLRASQGLEGADIKVSSITDGDFTFNGKKIFNDGLSTSALSIDTLNINNELTANGFHVQDVKADNCIEGPSAFVNVIGQYDNKSNTSTYPINEAIIRVNAKLSNDFAFIAPSAFINNYMSANCVSANCTSANYATFGASFDTSTTDAQEYPAPLIIGNLNDLHLNVTPTELTFRGSDNALRAARIIGSSIELLANSNSSNDAYIRVHGTDVMFGDNGPALSVDDNHIATNSDPTSNDASFKLATTNWVNNAISAAIANVGSGGSSTGGGTAVGNVPIGTILPWAGLKTNIPNGYVYCDGSCLSQEEYPELYAVIGATYNNHNSKVLSATQFVIPDLRGRYLIGASDDTKAGKTRIINTGIGKILRSSVPNLTGYIAPVMDVDGTLFTMTTDSVRRAESGRADYRGNFDASEYCSTYGRDTNNLSGVVTPAVVLNFIIKAKNSESDTSIPLSIDFALAAFWQFNYYDSLDAAHDDYYNVSNADDASQLKTHFNKTSASSTMTENTKVAVVRDDAFYSTDCPYTYHPASLQYPSAIQNVYNNTAISVVGIMQNGGRNFTQLANVKFPCYLKYIDCQTFQKFDDQTMTHDVALDLSQTELQNIPYRCFYNNSKITAIALPSTLTAIGAEAFCMASAIQSLDLPNCEFTGVSAFYDANALTNLTLGTSASSLRISYQTFALNTSDAYARTFTLPASFTMLTSSNLTDSVDVNSDNLMSINTEAWADVGFRHGDKIICGGTEFNIPE